jgi:hypothetical protein
VEQRAATCPLCQTPIQRLEKEPEQEEGKYPEQEPVGRISNWEVRVIVWSVLTILFITGFLVVLAVDLLLHGVLTWSGYAMIGIGGAWACSSLILLFLKRPSLIIAGQSIAVLGILVLVDVSDSKLDWFLTLGIPITCMIAGAVLLAYFLSMIFRFSVSMVFAFTLVAAGLLCMGLDLLISGYLGNARMTWSFIVLAATFPLTGLAMYYHFYLGKRFDIRKVFHL